MQIVPMTSAHLPDVWSLANALDPRLRLSLDYLRHCTFEDATCLPDRLLVAEAAGQVVGFCLGCIRPDTSGKLLNGRGVVKLFGVAPTYQRQGVATALFDALEATLRAHNVDEIVVEGASPDYFSPGVDLRHTDAVVFLLQRSYQTDRNARVDMDVDLTTVDLDTAPAEASLAAQGIVTRRATPAEVEVAAQFALDSFGAAWQHEVGDARRFARPPLFVALEGARVVSFAVYDTTGTARFGPTGTHPDYRQRGIGGVLLKYCLRDLRERGETLCEIGWAGPLGFYARAVGARIGRTYWGFRK
jgi:mycothiol synthase